MKPDASLSISLKVLFCLSEQPAKQNCKVDSFCLLPIFLVCFRSVNWHSRKPLMVKLLKWALCLWIYFKASNDWLWRMVCGSWIKLRRVPREKPENDKTSRIFLTVSICWWLATMRLVLTNRAQVQPGDENHNWFIYAKPALWPRKCWEIWMYVVCGMGRVRGSEAGYPLCKPATIMNSPRIVNYYRAQITSQSNSLL